MWAFKEVALKNINTWRTETNLELHLQIKCLNQAINEEIKYIKHSAIALLLEKPTHGIKMILKRPHLLKYE